MASWSLLDKVRGTKPAPDPIMRSESSGTESPGHGAVERPDALRQLLNEGPLDQVGQQSEHVRERISLLSLRLDDLKTLADDFGQIVQPLNDFVVQHTQTRAKLLETEALLAREREFLSMARAELNEVQASGTRMSGDLASALGELRSKEASLRDQDAVIAQFRLKVDDHASAVDNLEMQLASEAERARALTEDNQGLRLELDALENFRGRAENELAETREQINLSYAENARLQQLVETLTQRLSGLKAQFGELEPQVQAAREEISNLQSKLSAERSARQKIETQRELERSMQDSEISSLRMKIDGLNAQIVSSDKMLTNSKDQLRDRTESLRVAEKATKDLVVEKVAFERRAELAQEANSRMTLQMGELQRVNGDLKERCEMLAKALSAKDVLLESGNRKTANLEDRINELNLRAERERSAFEATNRRLIEELQSEKAERSLAQGALDIARTSRTKLLTQYAALKRQHGSANGRFNDLPDTELTDSSEIPNNVRVLKAPDRTE